MSQGICSDYKHTTTYWHRPEELLELVDVRNRAVGQPVKHLASLWNQ